MVSHRACRRSSGGSRGGHCEEEDEEEEWAQDRMHKNEQGLLETVFCRRAPESDDCGRNNCVVFEEERRMAVATRFCRRFCRCWRRSLLLLTLGVEMVVLAVVDAVDADFVVVVAVVVVDAVLDDFDIGYIET